MKKITVSALMMMAVFFSCSKGGDDSGGGGGNTLDCSSVPKSFSANVMPIVASVCSQSGCHNTGSTNGPGPLTNYMEVFNARALIRPAIASGFMPKDQTLSASQKNSFLCWIDSGAPDN